MTAEPSDAQARRSVLVRKVFVVVASVFAVVALVLIVFSTSQKQIEIGVLLGFWAGLIAAFLAFGSRRTLAEVDAVRESVESQIAELRESQIALVQVQTEHAVELRKRVEAAKTAEIIDPVALRHELNRLLTEQIGSLRDEIAGLRADMADRLGSQLRVERIETTRVVGADLDTLQREIRRLTSNQNRTIEAPADREDIVVSAVVSDAVEAVEHVSDAPIIDDETLVDDEPILDDQPPVPHVTADAFADLPRLSPVPVDVVDLIFDDTQASATAARTAGSASHAANEPSGDWKVRLEERRASGQPYVGRRRAMDSATTPPAAKDDAAGAAADHARPAGRRRAPGDR